MQTIWPPRPAPGRLPPIIRGQPPTHRPMSRPMGPGEGRQFPGMPMPGQAGPPQFNPVPGPHIGPPTGAPINGPAQMGPQPVGQGVGGQPSQGIPRPITLPQLRKQLAIMNLMQMMARMGKHHQAHSTRDTGLIPEV